VQCSESDVPAEDGWLHPQEAARLAAMRFPKRRADFRLGRWTAKKAVAGYLGLADPPQAIEIRAGSDGAPEAWIAGEPAGAAISISHRAGRAVCAVARAGTAIGCDIELIEPHGEAFLADYFTADEQQLVRRASNRESMETLLWSAKESAAKALRQGLRLDTRTLRVEIGASGALAVCHEGRVFRGWWQIEDRWVRTMLYGGPPGRRPASTSA
jgi:4'-phosphopantetheinyl transferase